jgi:putative membrane protein
MYEWHGWWPVMGLMWIFPLLFLVVVVALVLRSPWWSRDERSAPRRETAREVLERRYASGEITKEQFEDMKRTLGH